MQFPTDEVGIQAHLDHLALYAGAVGYPQIYAPSVNAARSTPDPRHFSSVFGTAPEVEDLGGKWAPSSDYGTVVATLVNELLATD
jgi:N-acetylmuramoyl-L-alanine amidase